MIENTAALEKAMNLPDGTITNAIASEENVSIEIPEMVIKTDDIIVRTLDQEEIFKTNLRTAGAEKATKDLAREMGYKESTRSLKSLLDQHGTSVLEGANKEPNETIKNLEADKLKLQNNITGLQTDLDESKLSFKKQIDSSNLNSQLLAGIKGEFVVPKEKVLTLIQPDIDAQLSDSGAVQFLKNGEVLKNKTTLAPLTIDEVIPDLTTQYLKKATGGNGGSDGTGKGKAGSMEAFLEEWDGKPVEDMNREMIKRIDLGTLKQK